MSTRLTRRLALGIAGAAALFAQAAAAQDRPVTLRLASAFDEKTDMMQAAKRFADLAKERSGGTVDVRIFAGGQMGGEKDNLEALKIGELDIGVFGTFPIVTLAPRYSFFDAPPSCSGTRTTSTRPGTPSSARASGTCSRRTASAASA